MGEPAAKRATYDDVLAAPADKIAEIVDGLTPYQQIYGDNASSL